jgi:hypothetical protein
MNGSKLHQADQAATFCCIAFIAAMASRMTSEFKAEFNSVLVQTKLPANELYQLSMKVLAKHKLTYTTKAQCKYFLVHKANRGGLMLSPHNVHRNASNIQKVGADLKQLTNAVAIELAPSGPNRTEQIAANRLLGERAGGLLANVTGEERFLTLGCGHTAAFCKLALEGGVTTQESLSDGDEGHMHDGVRCRFIALHKLTSNENFKSMIEEGWSWTVVCHEVDAEFPAFAKIAQKALNTSNHVATQVGELEAAVTLADLLDDTPIMKGKHDNGPDKWEKEAIAHVVDLCLPCSPYVKVLMDFVKLYGGGQGAPLVRFMDGVAKQFGCNATLGSSFWHAITYTILGGQSGTCKRPLTRVALALCNLQTDQKEDGIAKLLSTGDVRKLTSKGGLAQTNQLECMLKEAMEILEPVVKASGKVRDQFMKPMGQLFVRGALLCVGKPGKPVKGKVITNVELKQMFMEDMSEVAGTIIKYKDWSSDDVATDAQVDPEHDHEALTTSLADHSNPEWIAKQYNFVVGKLVQEKTAIGKAFKITSIDTNGVHLQLVGSYSEEVFEPVVKLQELIAGFKLATFHLPEKLAVEQMTINSVHKTAVRAMIWQALADAHAKAVQKPASSKICFWGTPKQVRTTSNSINANALCLVPFVPISGINAADGKPTPPSTVSFGKHDVKQGPAVEFYAGAPQCNVKPIWGENWVIAYWWVATTGVQAEANMSLEYKEVKGISIPCLVNHKEIPPFTKLCKFVKPQASMKVAGLTGECKVVSSQGLKKPRLSK